MNSYERVVAALEHRQPDRVPYVESVIDENLMRALLPGCDYYQFNEWLGMDSVGQNRSSWSRDNVQYVDKEKGLFRDKWGVIRAFGPESTPAPVEGPIKRPEDLKTYTPPDPEAPDVLGNIPEIVARYKGQKAITALVPAYPAMGIIYTYSLTDVWADPVAGPQYGTAADATHASSTNKVDFSPNGGTFTGSNARIGRFIVTQMLLTENVAAPGMTPLVQHNFSYDEV